jgi:hypothetical protein
MKNLFLFTLLLFCLIQCKNSNSTDQKSSAPEYKLVERIDTIVVFDPETLLEEVRVVKTMDTIR